MRSRQVRLHAISARGVGLATAAVTLAFDQASKYWILFVFGLEDREPVRLGPVLDLQVAWNTGVSYSLFGGNGEFGRYALLGLALVATLLLGVWLARARRMVTGVSLGLLVGGALGNAYDRFVHGAVADFFHVHFGGFSPWGVFNVADMAIVAGVALLLYEAVITRETRPGQSQPDG